MTGAEAHPVADLFPMLPDDELKDLAVSIATDGLLHPIVLDDEGRILDGRNRFAACELASVDPVFVTYDGKDPDGYALTVNLSRRHLSKGQAAMIAAKACPETGQTARQAGAQIGVSKSRIAQASVVLEWAPALAAPVIAGATSLDIAYKTACESKADADGDEAKLIRLRQEASDLADLVAEERMTLAEATSVLATREAEAKRERDAAIRYAGDLFTLAPSHLISLIGAVDPADWPVTWKQVDSLQEMLEQIKVELPA